MSDVKKEFTVKEELGNLKSLEELEYKGVLIQKQLVNYLKDKFYKQDLKLEGKRENLELDASGKKYISQIITDYNQLLFLLDKIKTTTYLGFKGKLRLYFGDMIRYIKQFSKNNIIKRNIYISFLAKNKNTNIIRKQLKNKINKITNKIEKKNKTTINTLQSRKNNLSVKNEQLSMLKSNTISNTDYGITKTEDNIFCGRDKFPTLETKNYRELKEKSKLNKNLHFYLKVKECEKEYNSRKYLNEIKKLNKDIFNLINVIPDKFVRREDGELLYERDEKGEVKYDDKKNPIYNPKQEKGKKPKTFLSSKKIKNYSKYTGNNPAWANMNNDNEIYEGGTFIYPKPRKTVFDRILFFPTEDYKSLNSEEKNELQGVLDEYKKNLSHLENDRYGFTYMNLKHADNIRYSIEPVSDLVINEEEKEEQIIQKIDNILSDEGTEESWKKWYEASDENKTEKIQWLGQLDSEFYTKNMFLYIYLKRLRALHKHSGIESGNFTADNFFYLYTLIHEINFDNELKVPHENMNDIELITGDEIKAISDYQVEKKESKLDKKELNKLKSIAVLAKEEEQNNKIIKWLQSTSGKNYITEVETQYKKVNTKIKLLIYFYEKYRIKDYYKLQKRGQYFYKNNALLLDTLKEIKIYDKQSLENLDFDITNLISIQKNIPELTQINTEYKDIELGFEIKEGNLDIDTSHQKMELLVNNENIQFVKITNMVMFLIEKIASMFRLGDCDYRENELPRKRCYNTNYENASVLLTNNCDTNVFKTNELDDIKNISYPNNIYNNINEERFKQTYYGFARDILKFTNCKKYFRSMGFREDNDKQEIWKSNLVEYSIVLNKYLTTCSIKNNKIPFPIKMIIPFNLIYSPKDTLKIDYEDIYLTDTNLIGILRIEHIHKNYNDPKYINEYKNKKYKNLKKQYEYLFIHKSTEDHDEYWIEAIETSFISININRQHCFQGSIFPKKNITFDEFNSLIRYYNANIYIQKKYPNQLLITLLTEKQLKQIYQVEKLENIGLIHVPYESVSKKIQIINHSVKEIFSYDFKITEPYIKELIKNIPNTLKEEIQHLKNKSQKKEQKLKELKEVENKLKRLENEYTNNIKIGGNKNIKLFINKFVEYNISNININLNIIYELVSDYYKFYINYNNGLHFTINFEIYNNIQIKFFFYDLKDISYKNILKYKTFNLLFYFNIELLHNFNLYHLKTKNVLEFSSSTKPSFLHCLLYKYPYKKFNLKQIYNNKYSYTDNFDKKLNSLSLLKNILGYTIDKDNNNYITKSFILVNDNKNQDIIYNDLSVNIRGLDNEFIENVNKQLQFSMFLYAVNHLSKGGHYISNFKILQTKASADICLIGKKLFQDVKLYRIKCQNLFKQSGIYVIFYGFKGISDKYNKELLDIFDRLYEYDPTGGTIFNVAEEKYRSTGNEQKNIQEDRYDITKPLIPNFKYKYIHEFLPIPETSPQYDFIREFNKYWFEKRIRHYQKLINIKQSPEKVQEYLINKYKKAQIVSSVLWANEFEMELDKKSDLLKGFNGTLNADFHPNDEIIHHFDSKMSKKKKKLSDITNIQDAYNSNMELYDYYHTILEEKKDDITHNSDISNSQALDLKSLKKLKKGEDVIFKVDLPFMTNRCFQDTYLLIKSFKQVVFRKEKSYSYSKSFYIYCFDYVKMANSTKNMKEYPENFIDQYLEVMGYLTNNILFYVERHVYYTEDMKYLKME